MNGHRLLAGLFSILFASVATAEELAAYNSYYQAAPANQTAHRASMSELDVRVASIDEYRNVPTFIWSSASSAQKASTYSTAVDAAYSYLAQHASLYRLSPAALATTYLQRIHAVGSSGFIAVFRQKVAGIEVIRNHLTVLMTDDLRLIAIGGNLHEHATDVAVGRHASSASAISARSALSLAVGDRYGLCLSPDVVRESKTSLHGYQHFELAPEARLMRDGHRLDVSARIKPVYFPLPDRIVLAHFVEFIETTAADATYGGYTYLIESNNGRVLYRKNLTTSAADEIYQYRVWADSTAPFTPLDGPLEDHTPHPTAVPDESEELNFVSPTMINVDSLNSMGDPWLPAGATETRGNNVDAYADLYDVDGFSAGDIRASLTGPRTFDYIYDPTLEPLASPSQSQAAVVQLFYVTNWLHDYFYDSGFTEDAGNAQDDNYGRTENGLPGDRLLAEAQNLGPNTNVRNNANMLTPADGESPRMQMFLWSSPDIKREVTVGTNNLLAGRADFGPRDFALTAPVVLANDGVDTPTDGCEPLMNGVAEIAGAIVLVDYGGPCIELQKAVHAFDAGAAGILVASDSPGGGAPTLSNIYPPFDQSIPALSISFEDGAQLKMDLASGQVVATMTRQGRVDLDGTIDNHLIAHEWAHYMHHRLVDCSSSQCRAQSEGWGDFIALHMTIRENDNYRDAYPFSIYATENFTGNAYFGLRRVPYSADPFRNDLSLRHIANGVALPTHHSVRDSGGPNSSVHSAGEVWATMLLEGYVALLETHDFQTAKRHMADYAVAGMVMAPVDPTFTEQRDAILSAAYVNDPNDALLLAQAFARRGAGTCALSPARDSVQFLDVQEDTRLVADIRLRSVTVSDNVETCDGDQILDLGETGMISVEIFNPSPIPLTAATLTLSSSALSFPDGHTTTIDRVEPFNSLELVFPVFIEGTVVTYDEIDFSLEISGADTCEGNTRTDHFIRANYNYIPSVDDTFDSERTSWNETVLLEPGFGGIWSRVISDVGTKDYVWHGFDPSFTSDTALNSPLIQVSGNQDFSFSFDHRHDFQTGSNGSVFYDGGVVEVSTDDGATWQDAMSYGAKTSYGGTITGRSNPLEGRSGFVGRNASWPNAERVTLNFGKQFAGQEIQVRFRLGADVSFGAFGWEVDDIRVQGAANAPFWSIGSNQGTCGEITWPIADAGTDLSVESGELVTLNASRSLDPGGRLLSFSWRQISRTDTLASVSLEGADTASPSFVAPQVENEQQLTFEVTVNNASGIASDQVTVRVTPRTWTIGIAGGGGCNFSVGGSAKNWPMVLIFSILLVTLSGRFRF